MRAILVAGLGFGDEGKGGTVDALVRRYDAKCVVRYNGGAQAAHNVCLTDGRHHTFSQFGSGTFVPGVKTYLSKHMLVNPIAMLSEGAHLERLGIKDCFERVFVDDCALVTTPYHVAANRIREMARDKSGGRHGSCGMGIGETMGDYLSLLKKGHGTVIRIFDLFPDNTFRAKLNYIRIDKLQELEKMHFEGCPFSTGECSCPFAKEWDILQDPSTVDLCIEKFMEFKAKVHLVAPNHEKTIVSGGTIIFEGAQGVLLDQDYGFHPYTTWTDITFRNAFEILERAGHTGDIKRIGVLRTYLTRHGAGPFPTEDKSLDHPELHNGNGPWQQGFRQGHFDLCLARYALKAIGGVDELSMTHVDRVQGTQKMCVSYDYQGHTMSEFDAETMWEVRENLATREQMTRVFGQFEPMYQTLNYTSEGFASEISKLLGVKIGMWAHGPTSEDRRV